VLSFVGVALSMVNWQTWSTPKCAANVPAEGGCHMPLTYQQCRLQLPCPKAAEVLAAAATVVFFS